MAQSNLPTGVRGPAYLREIRRPPGRREVPSRRTVLLVSERASRSVDALEQTMRPALREDASLCLLHVIPRSAPHDPLAVRTGFEMGELLTAAVLRVGAGRLPPLVTVIVYVGDREELLEFVTTAIQPTLVIAGQALAHEKSSP